MIATIAPAPTAAADRAPRLSRDEEQALCRAIARARPLRDRQRALARGAAGPPLSPEEADLLAAGHAAVATLVARNEGLMRNRARRFDRGDIPRERLYQAARVGVFRAAWKAEPRGRKFSTFATYYIDRFLAFELAECQAERAAYRVPSDAAAPRAPRAMSLEAPRGDTETPLGAVLGDPRAASPPEEAARRELAATVARALATLPRRDAEVARLRLGLRLTGAEVAERLGVTRQRVAQLEARALPRLRRALRALGVDPPPGRPVPMAQATTAGRRESVGKGRLVPGSTAHANAAWAAAYLEAWDGPRTPAGWPSCGRFGVTWSPRYRCWRGQFKVGGRSVLVGYGRDPEALSALCAAARAAHAGGAA